MERAQRSDFSLRTFLINNIYIFSAVIVIAAFYLINPRFLSLYSLQNIALEMAGLKESQVSYLRIHKDRDDGRTVYEGSFVSGELEYEFEINAADGRILDWERESIYD